MNEVNIEESEASIIEDKFPYLEYVWPGISSLAKMTERRLLKTHLPYCLLPEQLQNGTGKVCVITEPYFIILYLLRTDISNAIKHILYFIFRLCMSFAIQEMFVSLTFTLEGCWLSLLILDTSRTSLGHL